MWARGELRDTHDAAQSQAQVSDALAAFGLQADTAPPEDEPCYLWPENVPAWHLWQQVQTQWRITASSMGSAARTGLDYTAVEATLRLHRVRHPKRRFSELQAMERSALAAWAEQRE